ncbi:carboxylesterase family protein [Actinomadura sp. DC4]|uniref:carboxylesterase/lipase family protein n=1 Tax=Actinomadura sp. DC4 TaxID=3055069 RepID=UPI0025B030CD|nr:carboxylesterase family protein [Actinomadura sp. DC4]MDN3354370.1 carboxylesterase family protein [Actinomadura sp. DC4]
MRRTRRRGIAIAIGGLVGLGIVSPVAATTFGTGDPARTTSTLVETASGKVRGASLTGYDEWLGIPYAVSPTGSLRWTAPRPAARWGGVRDATRFGHRCVQGSGWDPGYESPTLTEDCLSLNVYAPHGTRGRRPVLVWIHGGGFTGGAGQDTNPRKFAQQAGAVVVTINYRLGALGFLSLPGLRGAGTFGLLDQQAALRWVKSNIGRFGGDAQNVTIAGQSAGGTSVCAQLASPAAKGLFARAIIMSGGCGLQSTADADRSGLAFVQQAGCAGAPDVLACLRGKPAADLLAAQQRAGVRPSVGGAAFPVDPAAAVPAGTFNRVPVLLGQVNNERALFTFQNYDYAGRPLTAAQYEALVRSAYGANADRVLAEYPVGRFASPGVAWTTVQNDSASYTRQVLYGRLSRYVPTYAYEFAESATPQFTSIYLIQQKSETARAFPFGATHVDDLGYIWDYLGQTLPYTDDELELSNQMIRYWGRFTAHGDPNGASTPGWPRYGPQTDAMMSLVACSTSPATGRPPAACSAVTDRFGVEHDTAFWKSLA